MVAKNNFSHSRLGKQFSNHSIKRKYKCLIWGILRPMHGRIESLISRSKKNRQLMSVSERTGKKAITNYKTLKVFNNKEIPKISLIECYYQIKGTGTLTIGATSEKNNFNTPGPTKEDIEAASEITSDDRKDMIKGMVENLAERMKNNPNDINGWKMLARSYRVLGQNKKAEEAEKMIKKLVIPKLR